MPRRLLLTAGIAGGLFLGANVVAERIAEGKIADRAQAAFGTAEPPAVALGGFPILVNILQGRTIPSASLEGTDLTVADLRVARFRIEIERITASLSELSSGGAIRVGRLLAQAEVTGEAVTNYVRDREPNRQVTITILRDGIRVTGPVPGGRTGTAEGTPRLVGRILKFEPDRISVDGKPLTGRARAAAAEALTFEVDVPLLPGGLRITAIDYRDGTAVLVARLENGSIDLSKDL